MKLILKAIWSVFEFWSSFNPVSTHLEAQNSFVSCHQNLARYSGMLRRPVELPVSRNVDTFLSDWYTMCIPFVSCWYTKMPYVSVPIFRIWIQRDWTVIQLVHTNTTQSCWRESAFYPTSMPTFGAGDVCTQIYIHRYDMIYIYIYIYSIHKISTYEVTIPSVGCISPSSPAPLTSASFRTSSLAGLLTGKAWRTAGDQVN